MGPTSRDEKIMMGVMLAAIVMWVLGEQLAITPVTAAMLGLSALLLTGVLKWKECLQYNQVRAGWCVSPAVRCRQMLPCPNYATWHRASEGWPRLPSRN